MNKSILISGVSERDIDLLLLEEFLSSLDFLQWFVTLSFGRGIIADRLLNARRSVTQSIGESDLEIVFEDVNGRHVMLLIENKIKSGLQLKQAERYNKRGVNYINNKTCNIFRTIIVAPNRYFGSSDNLKGFDARINYENIRDWFSRRDELGNRKQYKMALLTAAIEKGINGYQVIEDAPVNNFWRKYWLMAQENAPELEMKEPNSKPAKARWVHFQPKNFPQDIEIIHKWYQGKVDLQFSGMGNKLEDLEAKWGVYIDNDMSIEKANKSGSIRLYVPELDAAADFNQQAESVLKGLNAAKRLFNLYIKHRVR